MKHITIKNLVFFAFFITTLAACSKEFDALPGNQITQENLYASEEGFIAAANGLYATLQHPSYYGGAFITIPELYTPYSLSGGYDDPTLSRIYDAAIGADDIKVEATNPRIRNIWTSIYNTIRACNILLSYGLSTKPNVIQYDSVWNNIKGQALTIRALAHFDLLRLFGQHWNPSSQYGIPLMINKIPSSNDKPSRNTVNETYTAIIKDLDDAYPLLTNNNAPNPLWVEGAGKNYIDAIVVKALKARVLLYKGDKSNAATLAQDVIANSGIALSTNISKFYTSRNSDEENIFELSFSNQNPSSLNLTTFKNPSAFINDLVCGIDTSVFNPFLITTGDLDLTRYNLVSGDRTIKYASLPSLKNNPAYIIRLAEMYLILAEANNFDLSQLNPLRTARGTNTPTSTNDPDGMFAEIIAELNFEGAHVMCAKARLNIGNFQTNGKGIFPIPQAELLANPNMTQNP